MASTFSPLKIELIATGEQATTWGTTTNTNLGTALEEAIVGSANVTFASANVTLTLTDTSASQTARNLRLRLTGTSGGARDLIVPAIEKQYIVQNDCADTITIKNSTGTGVALPAGFSAMVYNDATNITSASMYSTSVLATTLAATNAAFVNALPVTSGGTGVTTSTGSGSVVLSNSPTLVTPNLGTPSTLVGTNITGTASGLSIGGNAATASNALGYNQTWQDVTASRAASTTYTNSTGRPIFLSVRMEQDDGTLNLTVDGLMIGRTGYTAGPVNYTLTAIVPAGSTYLVTTTGGTLFWYELR